MHKVRKRRLATVSVAVIVIGLALGLVLYAFKQNINLFYSPSDIAANKAPLNHSIRVGGVVEAGTVKRAGNGLDVRFAVTDKAHTVLIQYHGILPDLFREGQGIMAQGKLDKHGVLHATDVLAKHDEKYMPPEVAAAIKAQEMKLRGEA